MEDQSGRTSEPDNYHGAPRMSSSTTIEAYEAGATDHNEAAHKREYVGVARASTPEKGLPLEKGNASRSSLVQSSGNTTSPSSHRIASHRNSFPIASSGASFASLASLSEHIGTGRRSEIVRVCVIRGTISECSIRRDRRAAKVFLSVLDP